MATQYQLRIYNRSGVIQQVITDPLYISYSKEVNAPGLLVVDLTADNAAIGTLDLDWQIEVWRRNTDQGIDWYCDFHAFWRGEQRRADADGAARYTMYCPGQMDLIARSIVAYPAAITGRSVFASNNAESIAKTLVTYNATSTGTTTDGRARTVTTSGVTVEGDASRGNVLDVTCAWRRLLETLQDIAKQGGGDFDLVKTAAAAWEFRWYPAQLGTDRSTTLRFALNYGNITNPALTRNHMPERTVAVVGGQGQESSRTMVVRTGANYDATYNAVETFVDARQQTTTAGLQVAGDVALYNAQTRNDLAFDVIQAPGAYYGLHYFVGDLVTGVYEDASATKKINRVTITVDENGAESIQVELQDV